MFEALLQGEMDSHLGYDADGVKDVLELWIGESEGKHYWMQIFGEIRGGCAVHQHGWGVRLGRRGKEHLQGCGSTALHRTSDPQFHQIHTIKGLQGIHCPVKKGIWGAQPESGGSRI